jgi:excinuclease ABC subunit C
MRAKVRAGCGKGPGVYRFWAAGEPIYVGRSRSLRTRLLSYFRAEAGSKGNLIASAAEDVDWTETPSEFDCHLTELRLIKQMRPHYNSALKDDRDYVFIRVGPGPAPRLILSRAPTPYGPFRSPTRVSEAIRRLSDILQLRTSADSTPLINPRQVEMFDEAPRHPRCLRGQIGLCMAPCAGRVEMGAYRERLRAAERFLLGDEQGILQELRAKMTEASGRLEFERAGVFRDRLLKLEALAESLNFLRESLERLTFVYAVPGVEGKDTLYFVRGGRVLGRAPRVRGARQAEQAAALAAELLEPVTPPASGDEMDEIKVVASWFRARPLELTRTLGVSDFLADVRQWPEAATPPLQKTEAIPFPEAGLPGERRSA